MQKKKVVFGAQTKSVGKHMAEIRNDESAGLCYNPISTGILREARISREKPLHVTSHPGSSLDVHWSPELRFDSIFGGVTF
ncbi:hypothetical protein N7537_004420 [Penicillium hordei]|uniref:Uncharacterized protein n=1 Tax=Penicillium hordei TaxID=40994 RepID=A0AAD6EBB5_9EURO|nr:uncharacterized protein N7537_004420 [Penicillium hordei]KAJ5607801.1 hypothetical protein N7537_004420 [Penicillium hordei]